MWFQSTCSWQMRMTDVCRCGFSSQSQKCFWIPPFLSGDPHMCFEFTCGFLCRRLLNRRTERSRWATANILLACAPWLVVSCYSRMWWLTLSRPDLPRVNPLSGPRPAFSAQSMITAERTLRDRLYLDLPVNYTQISTKVNALYRTFKENYPRWNLTGSSIGVGLSLKYFSEIRIGSFCIILLIDGQTAPTTSWWMNPNNRYRWPKFVEC